MDTSKLVLDGQLISSLIFARSPNSISTEIENETIILDISQGLYSNLDTVGTTIWDSLAEPSTFSQLTDRISSDYEVGIEQCTKDLHVFLELLLDNGLIIVTTNEKDN